jgi:hypothetical protein
MVRTLDAATLLSAWEAAETVPDLRRPAVILGALLPDRSCEEWALSPIGERDRQLIQIREAWFGGQFETVATCPQCGGRMDVAFRTSDILAPAADEQPLHVTVAGEEIWFRLPNSQDLLEAARVGTAEMRTRLLALCVANAGTLSAEAEALVVEAMAKADPQADIRVSVRCAACERESALAFDVAAHLWEEIGDWAARLLNEVHVLASVYGWSERDVLAMSALRRRAYLQRIEA